MKIDSKVVFTAEGYTNDLLQISEAHNMKRTSLVYFNPISKEIGDEVITVSIDSDNEALTFPIFDKMINKKIRVTVETIDDNDSIKGNDSKDSVNVSNEIDDDNFVDLGLPSGAKWMKCNIGATKETDYGLFFQWGDIVGYDESTAAAHSTRSTCPGNGGASSDDTSALSTWNTANLTNNVLNTSVDAAYAHTNGKAKMPTLTQVNELVSGTNSEITTIDGVAGIKFTNKSDSSKYIFIPAAGYFNYGSRGDGGSSGGVWSSSLNTSDIDYAYGLGFDNSDVGTGDCYRCSAQSVRGVVA